MGVQCDIVKFKLTTNRYAWQPKKLRFWETTDLVALPAVQGQAKVIQTLISVYFYLKISTLNKEFQHPVNKILALTKYLWNRIFTFLKL